MTHAFVKRTNFPEEYTTSVFRAQEIFYPKMDLAGSFDT